MLSESQRAQQLTELRDATKRAKATLKPGDRIRVTKCPGTKRTITFDHFEGNEIFSKSGIGEYSARNIDRLNGQPISFRT